MPNTVTLPAAKTAAAPGQALDLSVYGVVLPVLTTEPTDSMFGTNPVDGTVVLQAGLSDAYYVQWVRINGTWRSTVMAI
jgi:hypothetical protein